MIYDVTSKWFKRFLTGLKPSTYLGKTLSNDTNANTTNNVSKPIGPTGSV